MSQYKNMELDSISIIKDEMIHKLPDVIKTLSKNYTNTLSSDSYRPTIPADVLGTMLVNIYEDGILFSTEDESKYYLYIGDKLLDLQNFNFNDDIDYILTKTEKENLKYFDSYIDFSKPELLVLQESEAYLRGKYEIFEAFYNDYNQGYTDYLNVYNPIYEDNKETFLEIAEQHRDTIESMDYDFDDALNSLQILQKFVDKNGGNIVEISIESDDVIFNGVKNFFYEKNGIYFNPSDEWFNANNSSLNTMFAKHLLEVGNDYQPSYILNVLKNTNSKVIYQDITKNRDIIMDNIKKHQLNDLTNVCVDIRRLYKHLTGMVNYEMAPEVLGTMLKEINKQGVLLETIKGEKQFYLYMNGGIFNLENYYYNEHIDLTTTEELNNLKLSQPIPLNDTEIEVLTSIINQLNVAQPFTYGIANEVFNNTNKNVLDIWNHVKSMNSNLCDSILKNYESIQLHIHQNLNAGFSYFGENQKTLFLLQQMVDLNGGKIIEVHSKNVEYNSIKEYFYEKNGLYFNPNNDFRQKISFSANDFFMEKIFTFGKVGTMASLLRDFSENEVSAFNAPTEINKPFEIIEKSLNDKSVEELLKDFIELNKKLAEVSNVLETKMKGISNE